MSTDEARAEDWDELWPILRQIAVAGQTFCWPRDITEAEARSLWMAPRPNIVLVLREEGRILGTATLHPNHGGPAAHVANAGAL